MSNKQIPYQVAYGWQEKLIEQQIQLQTKQLLTKEDVTHVQDPNERRCVGSILCLQHSSVYTQGSATTEDSGPFFTLMPNGKQLTYETIKVDRGGKVTYHGPGQFIIYPILDLVRLLSSLLC